MQARQRTPAGLRKAGRLRMLVPRPPAREIKPSAVIAAEQLEQLQPLINQAIGFVFMFGGLVGSIMMLHGAFVNALAIPLMIIGPLVAVATMRLIPRRTIRAVVAAGCVALLYAGNELGGDLVKAWAITGGLAYQGVVTLFQWTYCREKRNPRYFIPVLADAAANMRGYGFAMHAPLVNVLLMLSGRSWWERWSAVNDYTFYGAWGIIGVFSLIVAVAGEQLLVRK